MTRLVKDDGANSKGFYEMDSIVGLTIVAKSFCIAFNKTDMIELEIHSH